jgi:hypothetical protein
VLAKEKYGLRGREVAEHGAQEAHHIQENWGIQERILVGITPRSHARTILESGRRNTAFTAICWWLTFNSRTLPQKTRHL